MMIKEPVVNRLAGSASRSRGLLPATTLVVLGIVSWAFHAPARAQGPAIKLDVSAAKGDLVSPTFEGWYTVAGTTYGLFGYFNRNLEQVVEVPVGPNNKIEPGPIDQGQPTRFFTGQQFGVFAVALSSDRSKPTVIWTLTANGKTFSIPASLDPLYLIQPQRDDAGTYPGNTPPTIKFDPAGQTAQGPAGITVSRSAVVSRPLALDAWVTDDGLPPAPGAKGPAPALRGSPGGRPRRGSGLAVSWSVYRGPGEVTFSNPMPSLEDGRANTTATFSAPGEYIVRLLAQDSQTGNKCCWTNGYVKVSVQAADGAR
jgi:hypothetical protein